jgi:hypothetical protein
MAGHSAPVQVARINPALSLPPGGEGTIGEFMRRVVFRLLPVVVRGIGLLSLVTMIGTGAAMAQSGQDQSKTPPANAATDAAATKEAQRKVDEFTQAAQAINGPAGNPECVWLGRRVVGLMLNDDLDTAFRHLDLYDRFGCPGGHIQAAFRCVTRFGLPNPKEADAFNSRVHSCWINPAAQPQASTAAAPAGSTPPGAPATEQSTQGQAPAPAKQ